MTDILEKTMRSRERILTFASCERQSGEASFEEVAVVLTSERLMIIGPSEENFRLEAAAERTSARVINTKNREDGSTLAAFKLGKTKALLFFPLSWRTEAAAIIEGLRTGKIAEPAPGPPTAPETPAELDTLPSADVIHEKTAAAPPVDSFELTQEFAGLFADFGDEEPEE